jgi:hypothetical protein
LAHEYGGTAYLPPIIYIAHRAEDHRILVLLSDAALAEELVGKAVLKALTKNGKIMLTSPSNLRGNGESGASTSGKSTDAASVKGELNSLLLRQNLAKLTNGDTTIKVTNPEMLAKIKVHQLGSNIEDLPVHAAHMLTKLLAMNACAQIDYSGIGSKADAWRIAHFLTFDKDGTTLRSFKSMKDF